jgi:hypothetical protein
VEILRFSTQNGEIGGTVNPCVGGSSPPGGAFAFSTERATNPVNAQAREIGRWAFFVYPQDLLGSRVQTRVSTTSLFRGFAIS